MVCPQFKNLSNFQTLRQCFRNNNIVEMFESLTTKWLPIMTYMHPPEILQFFVLPVNILVDLITTLYLHKLRYNCINICISGNLRLHSDYSLLIFCRSTGRKMFSVKKNHINTVQLHCRYRGNRGCDLMVVGFITTYAISAYHY